MPHPRHVVCASLEEAAAAAAGSATRAWSRRPTARARRGSCSCATSEQLAAAFDARARRVAEQRRARRGARPGARGDGERVLGRRPVLAADRHRPGRRRAAGFRRRARPRLAELARARGGRRGGRGGARGGRRRSASRKGRPTRRSSSASAAPHVVELAARLGGGHDAELCRAALGVDLNALALSRGARRTGRRRAASPAGGGGRRAACASSSPSPASSQEVEGVEEAAAVEGVVWVRVYRAPGRRARPAAARLRPRRARCSRSGERATEALERAGRAADCVRFVTADAAQAVV